MEATRAAAAMLVLIVAAVTAAEGGHSAPAPADCTSVVLSMADCLSYVTNGSTVEKPEGNCCSGLKSVLKTNPDCLCEAFKSSSQFGVVLNVSKALALPTACGVHAPSATACGLSPSPVGAPAGGVNSPAGSPIANAPSTTGAGGNERAPSEAPANPSSSSSISVSIDLIAVGIAAAFFSCF